jgi:hypothetical protein
VGALQRVSTPTFKSPSRSSVLSNLIDGMHVSGVCVTLAAVECSGVGGEGGHTVRCVRENAKNAAVRTGMCTRQPHVVLCSAARKKERRNTGLVGLHERKNAVLQGETQEQSEVKRHEGGGLVVCAGLVGEWTLHVDEVIE